MMIDSKNRLQRLCLNGRCSICLAFGVIGVGILLRLLYLEADPYYYEWAGYITDEGRWVESARNWALFGGVFEQQNTLHFHLAPLFQIVNYMIFSLGGVSILTARIFTAFCGSAILVFFWFFLRRAITWPALLIGLVLLSFQTDLVVLSRIAVPEMVVMFFQLLVYFIVTSNGSSPRRMLLAGFLLFLAIGIKLTALPSLVIFSTIVLFIPRQHSGRTARRQAWRELLTFWTGFAVPLLVAALVWFIFIETSKSSLPVTLAVIKEFIYLSSSYQKISFPFDNHLSSTFNIWALGLWLSLLGWMAAGRDAIGFQSNRYFISSAIWFTLYLLLMLLLGYFPTRYKVHILVPMAVNVAVGISCLQQVTVSKVLESFSKMREPFRLLRVAILSFPTAAFFSPLIFSLIALGGANPAKFRLKLVSLFISFVVTAYAAHRLNDSKLGVAFFLTFPLIAATAWLMIKTFGASSYSFYPSTDIKYFAALWSLFLIGVSGVSIPIAKAAIGWGQIGAASCVVAFAMTYMVISLFSLSPAYMDPHYSIRDASQAIGRLYFGAHQIFTVRAEGLFNNNSLYYRKFDHRLRTSAKDEILVVAFATHQSVETFLEREYRIVNSYDIYLSPEFYRLHPATVSTFPRGKIVRVFKRK